MTDAELAARLDVLRRYGVSSFSWEETGAGGAKLAHAVTLFERTEADPSAAEKPSGAPEEKPLPTAAELALDPGRAREFGQAPAGDDE